MAVLQQCPRCKSIKSLKHDICECGEDLAKARRGQRVTYYIHYRLPNGKQIKQVVGTSLSDARDANGKRRGQKKEGRIFDMIPDAKVCFSDLAEWYLSLEKTKALASFKTVKIYLDKFNVEMGSMLVSDIRVTDLENLQEKRKRERMKAKTIDHEIETAKRVVWKAFKDDKVSGSVLKTFQNVPKLCKGHTNRREKVLTVTEYESLHKACPAHLKAILCAGYWTGMRKGEIINLRWDRVNLKDRTINLRAEDTKDREARVVPIGKHLHKTLSRLPRSIKSDHVFLYGNKPITKRFETGLKTACDKAGISWGRDVEGGFIFHDLRHTFVTDTRRAGIDRTVRMSITGHAIRDMDQRYDSVGVEDKHEAIKKLEGYRAEVTKTLLEAEPVGDK